MLPIHVTLQYYKRQDIREAIAQQCRAKEVAVQYGDTFGKRPDIIQYDKDVLSFATRKATSFHLSEEIWSNPMQLQPGMRQSEMNDLRVGWDLVIDIDFPVWEATREIAFAIIEQLRKENVPDEAITAKFSGNKGFHIAVPWEAFPYTYLDQSDVELLTSDAFPDGVKKIVEYIVHQLDGPQNNYTLSENLSKIVPHAKLQPMLITVEEATGKHVKNIEDVSKNHFHCANCNWRGKDENEYITCPTPGCGALLTPVPKDESQQLGKLRKKVDLAVDTLLISSRHMYRACYSLHEKSGLASVPVPLDNVRTYDKQSAQPTKVTTQIPFLNRNIPQECARQLLQNGLAFESPNAEPPRDYSQMEWSGDAAPEELFPPPITALLGPLRDGRQRALFVLTNFLVSVGWTYDMIEKRLEEWNEQHPEPMRETVLRGHIRHHKQKKDKVLPPNFSQDNYYKDILGKVPHDELSQRVKNPVQYVRLRIKQTGKKTNTDKQKNKQHSDDS